MKNGGWTSAWEKESAEVATTSTTGTSRASMHLIDELGALRFTSAAVARASSSLDWGVEGSVLDRRVSGLFGVCPGATTHGNSGASKNSPALPDGMALGDGVDFGTATSEIRGSRCERSA